MTTHASPIGRFGRTRILAIAAIVAVLVLLANRNARAGHPHVNDHAHGAAPAHHHHDTGDAHAMAPPEGGWQTDEPLRTGMRHIRTAVSTVIDAHHKNALRAAEARTLTAAINAQFAYMAEHCRLAPDADAALHGIIVQLLEGSARLEADPRSRDALHQIAAALGTYAASFDHEGFEPINLAE